jgi:beta-glucanase (GH16 family)
VNDRPLGLRGRWERVFTEDFDGETLDGERWTTCYWWNKEGCTNLANNELQWYSPANVQVADGYLRLSARAEQAKGIEARTFPYTSGMVTTGRDYVELPRNPRFAIQYGFFEICAKIPVGRGLWPALWLLPADHDSRPEIDIMEVLGHQPTALEMNFHYRDKNDADRNVGHQVKTRDLSANWHVYGLLWSADTLVWYLDGIEQWRYRNRAIIPREPMYLLMNLAVGGNWPGNPDNGTVFPAEFLIDYVKVWKQTSS